MLRPFAPVNCASPDQTVHIRMASRQCLEIIRILNVWCDLVRSGDGKYIVWASMTWKKRAAFRAAWSSYVHSKSRFSYEAALDWIAKWGWLNEPFNEKMPVPIANTQTSHCTLAAFTSKNTLKLFIVYANCGNSNQTALQRSLIWLHCLHMLLGTFLDSTSQIL